MKKLFGKKGSDSSQDKFNMPQKLRVRMAKIVQLLVKDIVVESFPYVPRPFESPENDFYQRLHDVLTYEFGEFNLGGSLKSKKEDILIFLRKTEDSEKLLKAIEYLFRFAYEGIRDAPSYLRTELLESFHEIVAELNRNFDENNIGYQYEAGRMIRIDSHFTHQEIIKPVLTILANSMYKGANEEFLSAYDHYQAGRYKESMNECLKAFESCMKSICQKRKWSYNQTATAKKLIDTLFNEGLFPKYMLSQFNGVRSILQDGIPTMRNKQSGHGQGPKVIPVPKHMARYALNLTASNIILLADLERNIT